MTFTISIFPYQPCDRQLTVYNLDHLLFSSQYLLNNNMPNKLSLCCAIPLVPTIIPICTILLSNIFTSDLKIRVQTQYQANVLQLGIGEGHKR